ncbi:hypothetical protein FACUT_6009 [Fusarium acutatum]|uniref:Uncharacterized protein n=1 Tax=Fusarium acutatum TaxID=78861 RepID=A0A8H4JQA5_9HYPO|nr:hypothetical protein FACUT_6009 [Fusarium acutatum]
MASSEPHTESLKSKALSRRFSDELLAAIISSDKFGIQDMQPYVDEYRAWCQDLEEEEKAIREDKTICVIEPSDPSETVACSTTPEPCCSTDTNGSIDALRPKPGEVYCAYHEQSQRRLAAVILPLTDPGSIGILGTMETLGFSKNVPNCVVFNVNSGRLEWRDGYGDGEPSSHARKYPVIYFTGRRFPENEAAGWVSAEDLRVLDEGNLRASDIPFYRAIRAYLERRTLCQAFRERLCDPETPLMESNKVLRSHDGSRFCPGAPLAAPYVYLTGPDKSRFSTGPSSWSARSYGRSLIQGYLKKAPVPEYCKLPVPRPTNPGRSCHRKMPSTLNLPDSCRLTRFVVGKHEPKATTLPPLNTLRDLALGAQLGLFAWPEELSPRILNRLRKELKVALVFNAILDLPNHESLDEGQLLPALLQRPLSDRHLIHSFAQVLLNAYQDSAVDQKCNTNKARVQQEVRVMPQLATPDPEPELQLSKAPPSSSNSSNDQRDHDGEHTAEPDISPQVPYIIAQSIEEFIQESQDEISYFSSAENSEKTYQILSALIDGDAVLDDEPQEEARWSDGAEWLSLLESGRKDRKKGTICYAITAVAFARWHATQVRLFGDEVTGQQASQQVSARILDSYTDGDMKKREKQRKKLNTHLARGRKWLRLVEALGMGILFKQAWYLLSKLAKSPEPVIDVIVDTMPDDKMIVLRLLGDQMKLLLQTGRTNTDSFCNDLKMQGLASNQATFTTSFTQLQEIQTSVTDSELVVRRCMQDSIP